MLRGPPPERRFRSSVEADERRGGARSHDRDRSAQAAILALQQSAGNRAVVRLLARSDRDQVLQQIASRPFSELWGDFEAAQASDPALARALAPRVVDALHDRDEVRAHGLALADWLLASGLNDLARRVLDRLEITWTVSHAMEEDVLPASLDPGTVAPTDLIDLIDRGEAAARAGDFPLAQSVLTRAFMLLVLAAENETRGRGSSLEAIPPESVELGVLAMFRSRTYDSLGASYDAMRRILRIHRSVERDLRSAGDATGARGAADAGTRLREEIFARYIPSADFMTIEVTSVETPWGSAVRMHGANDVSADLTHLPGLRPPSTVGSTYDRESSQEVAQTLTGQADLLEDLLADPEVARAFPDGDIDMNDTSDRVRVWNAMFRSYRQRDGADALRLLMDLIGRYLQVFTIHTEYNVRDWGVSYLESEQPTDLVDRAERDCGVYALTVAYEVYRAARDASPRLDLTFQLVAAPAHVMLVIRDGPRMFLVNNDEVTGPRTDTKAIAEGFARVANLANLVTPVALTDAGSTELGEHAFRERLWAGYQDVTSWRIAPQPPGGDPGTEHERRTAAYERMYREQREFSAGARRLADSLDRLGTAPSLDDLTALRPLYSQLSVILLWYSVFPDSDPMSPRRIVSEARPQARERLVFGAAIYSVGDARHPVMRVYDRLTELERLGADLPDEDDEFRRTIDRVLVQAPVLAGAPVSP